MEHKLGELIDQETKKIYTILYLMGKGAYGKVYYAIDLETKGQYSIKVLFEEEKYFKQKMFIIKKISSLKCPYIIKLMSYGKGIIKLGDMQEEGKDYFVYEYASNGTLIDYLTNITPNTFLEEKYAKILFKYILKAIGSMHNNITFPLCHRDIKLENILIDDTLFPKICDFGFANWAAEGRILSDQAGTYGYCGPEILVDDDDRGYDGKKADIFSLGITLLKIVTGKKGYDHYKYISNFDNYFASLEVNNLYLTDKVKNLIKKMIKYNPNERPDINELINDPWFEDFNENDINQINDYQKELNRRYEQIKNKNPVINPKPKKEDNQPKYNKSATNDDNKDDFKEDFVLQKIDDKKCNLKDYIIINCGDIKPRIIMNSITKTLREELKEYVNNENKIKNEEGNFFLNASKNYFKFKIKIEYEKDESEKDEKENNEEDEDIPEEDKEETENKIINFKKFIKKKDLIIRAILLKSYNGYLILRFYKISGDIEEYYEKLEKIISYIKDL